MLPVKPFNDIGGVHNAADVFVVLKVTLSRGQFFRQDSITLG